MATKFTKSTFKAITNGKLEEHGGYTFEYTLEDGRAVQLGIRKIDDDKPLWEVIDLNCGLRICKGATREEAVKTSEGMRKKYTEYMATPDYAKQAADFAKTLESKKPKAAKKPRSIRTTTASLAPSEPAKPKAPAKAPAKPKAPAKKAPSKTDETAALKKRIAELEAELAEAKKPVADAAATVSLTELCGKMQGWCSQHPNTCATYIPKPGAVVKIHGVLKEHEAWQKELAGMGFRWAGKAGVWYFGEKEAAKLGKVAVIE